MKRRLFITVTVALILCLHLANLWITKPGCETYKTLGLYCGGCGLTRCITSLLSFNFYQAFRYNPFCFLTFPIFLPFVVFMVEEWVRTGYLPKGFDKALKIYAVAFCLFSILRNFEMFKFLQPTVVG